jgi:hypothetical protein
MASGLPTEWGPMRLDSDQVLAVLRGGSGRQMRRLISELAVQPSQARALFAELAWNRDPVVRA